jgi:hypothetical protein
MKTKLLLAIIILGCLTCGLLAGGSRGSHPAWPNNGKDSPRFYASPHGRPAHPQHP